MFYRMTSSCLSLKDTECAHGMCAIYLRSLLETCDEGTQLLVRCLDSLHTHQMLLDMLLISSHISYNGSRSQRWEHIHDQYGKSDGARLYSQKVSSPE
jgi:hypothetical protein